MTPQQMAQHYREKKLFEEVMKNAVPADFPVHEKVWEKRVQRTHGNKHLDDTRVSKASQWIASILKGDK